jgi:P-type Cu+ transporter
LGGTICSETGTGSFDTKEMTAAVFVRVTGVGSSTALAQIVQLVQQAQSRQVPIQNLADTIAAIFVPTVVGLSLFTFLAWYGCCKSGIVPTSWYHGESPATFSLLFGIACLVISCPCALGLATPTAVMVGTGVGARHGILMKGGETMEVASRIDCIVFDKTGTLTSGKPAVTDFKRVAADDELRESIDAVGEKMALDDFHLWLLGSLERNSEHPLAAAVVTYAEEKLGNVLKRTPFAQPSNFLALTGRGASGVINGGVKVSMGNRAFASRENMVITDSVEQTMQEFETQGKTAVLVGLNGTVSAVIGLADQVKEGASESIRYLKDLGIDVWMVTGDSARTATAIAEYLELPANRVISEALPSSKVDHVRMLQSLGHRVAMVGDGVNDSPALVEADVGMSMGTGADIATEASDMVLVSGKVTDVCTAVNLSRVIFRRIQVGPVSQ